MSASSLTIRNVRPSLREIMSDDFVRKDLHDANMAEIRALMAASEAQHQRIATEIKADSDTFRAEFRGEIKNLHTRIDGVIDTFSVAINDMKEAQSQTLAKWAIGVAVLVGVVQVVVSVVLNFWR